MGGPYRRGVAEPGSGGEAHLSDCELVREMKPVLPFYKVLDIRRS
jgi:hypothetical protein